jgi:hypothetical protein
VWNFTGSDHVPDACLRAHVEAAYPYKRGYLFALRPTKISANDPLAT